MNIRLILVCAALAAPLSAPLAFGQKKNEMVELQRDVALLQDQVRTMQRTLDEKLAALTVLVQQSVDGSNKANTAVAVLQSGITEKMNEQAKSVVAPVANLGVKVDQMGEEMRGVRESVADMNSRLGKFDARLVDVKNAITVAQNPVCPPSGSGPGAPPQAAVVNTPPAGMSAATTFDNAYRDYMAGKRDLAIEEFSAYLKYFKDTEQAHEAAFYIAYAQYLKGDFEAAAKSFDQVVEQFQENKKTAEALYMKGVSLMKAEQRTAAAAEYKQVIKRYPGSDWATKSANNLKQMGLSTGATPPRGKKK